MQKRVVRNENDGREISGFEHLHGIAAAVCLWLGLLTIMIWLGFCRFPSFAEETSRKVRVAFPYQEGISGFTKDGKPYGYNCEYLQKIAEYTGWELEFVEYEDEDPKEALKKALDDVKNNKVDLIGPILKTNETKDSYALSSESYGTVYTTLCALKESNLQENGLSEAGTIRVGLLSAAEVRNYEILAHLTNNRTDYKIFYYNTDEEMEEALRDHQIDVISGNSLAPVTGTKIIEKFAPRSYYFASAKENEGLISELDAAVRILNRTQPRYQTVLFERYFQTTDGEFSLTDSEKTYLSSLEPLRVLCVDQDAPYVYLWDGKPEGFLVNILDAFSEATGVPVTYTVCQNREEMEENISKSTYDMVIGLPFSSEYCAGIGYVRSTEITESELAMIHDENYRADGTAVIMHGLEDLVDVSGYETVVCADNAKECIQMIAKGQADLAIGDRSAFEYYIYDTNVHMTLIPLTGVTQRVVTAIRRDCDLRLIEIFNRYLKSLSKAQVTTYMADISTHMHEDSLIAHIRRYPVQASVILGLLVTVIVGGTTMIYHARVLAEKNQELERSMMEAERANRSKTDFLRRMSHDIRTPLNGIIGMLHIMDRYENDPKKQKECREKMLHSADYLLDLVNNVLDISKLESDSMELEHKPFDLGELLLKTLPTVETNAREHGISFEGGREATTIHHRKLIGSPLHLNRVLMNIASNAIKYNRTGGKVKLYCTELSCDGKTAVYRFVSEDTGLGMSEEFQKRAFEPFSQEGKQTTTSFSGSGLGLSIVKNIVELMHGDIKLTSRENVGTKFVITIPFELDPDGESKEKKEATEEENIPDLSGKRALLVEDNPLNMEIAKAILEETGLLITEAKDGTEALRIFADSEPGDFSYIFMDVMMPVMDGLEATRRIRALKKEDAASVIILAMTANAFQDDIKECLAAGMNAHLAKPLSVEQIYKELRRFS